MNAPSAGRASGVTRTTAPIAAEAASALDRAVGFAGRALHAEGCWEAPPDPRIFDTAIPVLCLAAVGGPGQPEIERGRRWLADAEPQRHDPFVAAVEKWLRHTALGDADSTAAPGRIPAPPGRALLLEVLAVCAGSPGAQPRRLRELVAEVGPRAGMKQWHRALLAAAEIIGHVHLGAAVPNGLVEALEQEQDEDGGFCRMPAITAIAYVALADTGQDRPSVRRCRENLRRGQNSDGTWRYLSFDIWDTTLMVRSLRGIPAFDEHLLEPALGFVERTQSADGGWACKRGIESDNDTTSSALLALAGTARAHRVLPAATRYLRQVQRPDGLWTTWQSADDTPSTDVTAHVVTAVTAHPSATVEVSRAAEWLIARHGNGDGWSAQWYPNAAYAVAEIGEAVGWTHRTSHAAARGLLDGQRPDGGWPLAPDDPCSDPAATGLALTACLRSGIDLPPTALHDAVAFLVREQTADGTWHGAPAMAGPRPFLNHLPLHTHAFVAAGLRDFLRSGRA